MYSAFYQKGKIVLPGENKHCRSMQSQNLQIEVILNYLFYQ